LRKLREKGMDSKFGHIYQHIVIQGYKKFSVAVALFHMKSSAEADV
jgi:hypothetical protein